MPIVFTLYFYIPLWLFFWSNPDEVFYQSDKLVDFGFSVSPEYYSILDDGGDEIGITAITDNNGILYWYRRIRTPVCLTGECKLIDIGIYWYCTGEFLGLEVYGEHLTKTDHSDFSQKDYDRLMEILDNDWSKLREYELSDLVEDVLEDNLNDNPDVDGTSGATKKEIAAEAVEDAVYTTHTIWHLIHVGEKEQLINLTASLLNEDKELYKNFLKVNDKSYDLFLLELIATGKVKQSHLTNSLAIEGLKSTDTPQLRSMAIKALPKCDFKDASFQTELAGIYHHSSLEEKLQMLSSFQNIPTINRDLFDTILDEMEKNNDWYAVRVFQVFKNMEYFDQELIGIAGQLKNSDNPLVKKTANEFLNGKR